MHLAEARGAESTGVEFAGTARRQRLKGEGEGGDFTKGRANDKKTGENIELRTFYDCFFRYA